MKKISILLSVAILLVSIGGAVPALAAEPQQLPFEVQSQAVYMENLETGQVMLEKNPDKRFAPASLAKIMTAIVTLENVKDIENETHTLKSSVNHRLVGTGLKVGGIFPGDTISIKDLLYDAVVFSGADAAIMLADYVSDGSINYFVEMMNERAQALGCTNTLFTDPYGLDEEQYTTAHDMAIMVKHAMTIPEFAKMAATTDYQVTVVNRNNSFYIGTTNSLMRSGSPYYYAPVQGVKTGTITKERTLATIAKKDGYSYLLVQLGVPSASADGSDTVVSFDEAKRLYEWVFDSFQIRTAVERGEELVELPVKYSMHGDFVRLATADQFVALLHKNIDVSSILYVPDIPDYLIAPVEKGTEIGRLKLIYMEEEIGSVPLVTTASLGQSEFLALVGKLGNEIHTFRAKFIIIFTVLIIALYTALIIRAQNLRKRSGKYSSYRTAGDSKSSFNI